MCPQTITLPSTQAQTLPTGFLVQTVNTPQRCCASADYHPTIDLSANPPDRFLAQTVHPPGYKKPPAGKSPRQGGSRAEPWYLALGTVHTCIPSPYTRWQPPKSSPRRREAPGKGKPPAGKSPRQGGSRAEPWYLALGTVHTVAQK